MAEPTPMTAAEVARVIDEIGRLLDFRGENPFKVRAYRNGARTLATLEEDLGTVVAEGRLRSLPGIGAALADKVETLVATGSLPLHERLRAEVPIGVVEMAEVDGIGPKKALAIHERLGIGSVEELAEAAASGRLAEVPGFGERTVARIADAVVRRREYAGRFRHAEARAAGEALLARVRATTGVAAAEIVGGLRRMLEVVPDVDLVAASRDPERVAAAFCASPLAAAVVAREPGRCAIRLATGLVADLRVVDPRAFPVALFTFTGSAGHVERVRARAARKKVDLDALEVADEAAVYAALGLQWVPPELREDRGEVDAAARNRLPRLIEPGDLKGVVHCHTLWSDGRATVLAMAEAARALGYEYLVVCDHSRNAAYAGGLSIEDLAAQREEIDAANAELAGFRVLAGSEVDVLADGALDYPDEVLAGLDCVVASVHSMFRLPKSQQTRRLVRAIANPWLDVLGHPTGRLLLARDGYDVDLDAVFDACAEHGVAIELNGDPRRLDLDWRHHKAALERGVRFSIDPDAHGPETIGVLDFAVAIGRKGWLRAEDVINARPVDDFLAGLRRNR